MLLIRSAGGDHCKLHSSFYIFSDHRSYLWHILHMNIAMIFESRMDEQPLNRWSSIWCDVLSDKHDVDWLLVWNFKLLHSVSNEDYRLYPYPCWLVIQVLNQHGIPLTMFMLYISTWCFVFYLCMLGSAGYCWDVMRLGSGWQGWK